MCFEKHPMRLRVFYLGKLNPLPFELLELVIPTPTRRFFDQHFVLIRESKPASIEGPVMELTDPDAVPYIITAAVLFRIDLSCFYLWSAGKRLPTAPTDSTLLIVGS
jgi:hypothetical protein